MRIKLAEKPKVKEDFEKALALINEKKLANRDVSIKKIVANDDIKAMLLDILELSYISPSQKAFLKATFIEGVPENKAIKRIFGRDLGYQAEAIKLGIMQSAAVKEYMDIIKSLYIRIAPVAQLKEVEIMLNPFTKSETALKAAKDIQDRAGVGTDGQKSQLPVTVVIQLPGANPTQVNIKEGDKTL